MFKSAKAIVIFAGMVATPLVLDSLLNRKTTLALDFQLEAWLANVLFVLAAFAAVIGVLGPLLIKLVIGSDKLDFVADCLKLAERDLNDCLGSGMEHGGRKGRVNERYEWNRLVKNPAKQVLQAGYQTVAHDLVKANEDEVQGKRKAMGKASMTAFLLRELYEGSVESAQRKIVADTKNGDMVPYVAPGIRELVGFESFDKEKGFAGGSGVDWLALRAAVMLWRFPKYILMVKAREDGEKTVLRRWDVIKELTQQLPPKG